MGNWEVLCKTLCFKNKNKQTPTDTRGVSKVTTNGIMLQNEKLVKASSKNGIVTDPFKDAEEFHYK